MYAIALIRYRRPLEDVLAVQEQHRSYLRTRGSESLKNGALQGIEWVNGSSPRGVVLVARARKTD